MKQPLEPEELKTKKKVVVVGRKSHDYSKFLSMEGSTWIRSPQADIIFIAVIIWSELMRQLGSLRSVYT